MKQYFLGLALAATSVLWVAPQVAVAQTEFDFDPSAYHVYFNDFDIYTTTNWTLTTVEAGAGSATEAVSGADDGVLLITNDAADDDSDFFQLINETFTFEAGKRMLFKARFQVSDATQSDFVIGLQLTDTTPLDVSDGIFFQKDDGDALLDFHAEENTVASNATGIHTMVAATWTTVGFYYNGTDANIQLFVDDVNVGSVPITNAVDDEALAISFGIQNGEAVAKTMTVDYLLAAKER